MFFNANDLHLKDSVLEKQAAFVQVLGVFYLTLELLELLFTARLLVVALDLPFCDLQLSVEESVVINRSLLNGIHGAVVAQLFF